MPGLQRAKETAALDAGQLTVVAGENEFGAGPSRFVHKPAEEFGSDHRRLVDDDGRAGVPGAAAAFEGEQLGMEGRGAVETARTQILRHRIGGGEADRLIPVFAIAGADGGKDEALAGAGLPIDEGEAPGTGCVRYGPCLLTADPGEAFLR